MGLAAVIVETRPQPSPPCCHLQAAPPQEGPLRTHPSLLLSLLLSLPSAALAAGGPPPEARLVAFPGPEGELRGFLYLPPGPGPFPAVLWNHGSEALPGWQPELAHFYTSHG